MSTHLQAQTQTRTVFIQWLKTHEPPKPTQKQQYIFICSLSHSCFSATLCSAAPPLSLIPLCNLIWLKGVISADGCSSRCTCLWGIEGRGVLLSDGCLQSSYGHIMPFSLPSCFCCGSAWVWKSS